MPFPKARVSPGLQADRRPLPISRSCMAHGGKGSKEEACIHLLEPLQPRITGPGAAGIVIWLSTWRSRGLKASGRPVFYSQLYFLASHALCLSIPQLPRLLSGRTVHFNVQQALTMRDLPGTAPGPQKALHEASSCHCSCCTGLLSACELVCIVPSIREQCCGATVCLGHRSGGSFCIMPSSSATPTTWPFHARVTVQ